MDYFFTHLANKKFDVFHNALIIFVKNFLLFEYIYFEKFSSLNIEFFIELF